MKSTEPWLSNIAWSKLLTFLAIVALFLNQLNTAPVPGSWHPWLMWGGSFLSALIGFILNPKDKPWIETPTEEETPAPAPVPTPVPWPTQAAPAPTPVSTLTPAEVATLRRQLAAYEATQTQTQNGTPS